MTDAVGTGAANDVTVVVTEQPDANFLRAAIAHTVGQLALAEQAVESTQFKVARREFELNSAKESVQASIVTRDKLKSELEAWKSQLAEQEG
jgi:molybdopterin synthase catalytic subunit